MGSNPTIEVHILIHSQSIFWFVMSKICGNSMSWLLFWLGTNQWSPSSLLDSSFKFLQVSFCHHQSCPGCNGLNLLQLIVTSGECLALVVHHHQRLFKLSHQSPVLVLSNCQRHCQAFFTAKQWNLKSWCNFPKFWNFLKIPSGVYCRIHRFVPT